MPDESHMKTKQDQPWFHAFLKLPYLVLGAGFVLLLSSFGKLKLGIFEFTPSTDSAIDIRIFLASGGLILVLLGATLILNREGIWRPRLGALYFVASLLVLGGVGYLNYSQPEAGPAPTYQEMRLFNNWDVTDERFFSQIATSRLAPLQQGNVLLLLCRKNDPTVEFEADTRIQKSQRFEIRPDEPLQSMAVAFTPDFSDSLSDGDLIECGLVFVPATAQVDEIHAPADVVDLGGEILSFASDDVAAPRVSGPPGN